MNKNPYYYIGANPTVDLVIMNHLDEILFIHRAASSEACPLMQAFPGGFQDTTAKRNEKWLAGFETEENAAKREVREETNLDLEDVKVYQIGVYEGNGRDPRDNEISWSKSTAFFYQMDESTFNKIRDSLKPDDGEGGEIAKLEWTPVFKALNTTLAFDHNKILIDCLKQYKPEILEAYALMDISNSAKISNKNKF